MLSLWTIDFFLNDLTWSVNIQTAVENHGNNIQLFHPCWESSGQSKPKFLFLTTIKHWTGEAYHLRNGCANLPASQHDCVVTLLLGASIHYNTKRSRGSLKSPSRDCALKWCDSLHASMQQQAKYSIMGEWSTTKRSFGPPGWGFSWTGCSVGKNNGMVIDPNKWASSWLSLAAFLTGYCKNRRIWGKTHIVLLLSRWTP